MSEQTAELVTADSPAPAEPDEALREPGKKALEAERNARKSAEQNAAELAAKLKEFEDAKLTELERAKKQQEESAAELAQLRQQNVRNSVALAKGIPADLVEFLTGDTEEEVAAKADILLSRLNTPTSPKPDPSQGAKDGALALNGDPLLGAIQTKLGLA